MRARFPLMKTTTVYALTNQKRLRFAIKFELPLKQAKAKIFVNLKHSFNVLKCEKSFKRFMEIRLIH